MKALAIRQPWAWLIVHGIKEVENRSWRTHHRGPFLIHASKKMSSEDVLWVQECVSKSEIDIVVPDDLPRGGIVGVARLVDCVERDGKSWGERLLSRVSSMGRAASCLDQLKGTASSADYGFILEDARPLPFVRWRGRLSFFEVPDDLLGSELEAYLAKNE